MPAQRGLASLRWSGGALTGLRGVPRSGYLEFQFEDFGKGENMAQGEGLSDASEG